MFLHFSINYKVNNKGSKFRIWKLQLETSSLDDSDSLMDANVQVLGNFE